MNKIYRVIWSTAHHCWVVTSELAKGKQKSSSENKTNIKQIKLNLNKLAKLLLLTGLFNTGIAFAADACSVSNATEFGAALNNNDCTEIDLTATINLADYRDGKTYAPANTIKGETYNTTYTTRFDFGNRTNIVINGNNKYGINVGNNANYSLMARGGDADNQVTLTFSNLSLSNPSPTTSKHPLVYVPDYKSNINVVFDNIDSVGDQSLAILSYGADANQGGNMPNQNGYTTNQNILSKVTIGTFNNQVQMKPNTNKQWVNASKIDFTGKLDFVGIGGGSTSYSYVFWNNTYDLSQNQLTFKAGSDTSFDLQYYNPGKPSSNGVKFTSGDNGNGKGYSYVFEDGSQFLLWSLQNVFGDATGNNVGVQIGSYDKETGLFGSGAKIQVAGVGGSVLSGDGLTNLGGQNYANGQWSHSIVNNGEYNPGDVIFNLAAGSKFNVNGTGINVIKSEYLYDANNNLTTTKNDSGIYIRSATDITGATGISVTHDGTGEVIVKNVGQLDTTSGGIVLNSSTGNTMQVDLSQDEQDQHEGIINVSGGSGIIAGKNYASGNVNVNVTGGTINLSGSANGFDFSAGESTNHHTITGTTLNFASGATGTAILNSNTNVTLKDTHVNVINSTAFIEEDLAHITFANSDANTNNIVTVTGSGMGFELASDLSALKDSYLTVNVTDSAGTAIKIAGGDTSDIITVTDNMNINANGATALAIAGNQARQLVNDGVVNGDVLFNNGAVANIITNNNTLDGNLTTGNGNNTLNLNKNSSSKGTISLGNGNNTVNIGDNTYVNNVTAGSGSNTFNLSDMSADSNNYIGTLDAGTGSGTNTLNLSSSALTLNSESFLKNFNDINLTDSSLSLVSQTNISAGEIKTDGQSSLMFDGSYNGDFTADLSGTGKADVNNKADVTLTKDSTFAGIWQVEEDGTLNTTAVGQLGTATANIDGILNLNQTSFNNALQGSGQVNIDANGNQFNFGSDVGNKFTGTVDLTDTQMTIDANNSNPLTDATLQVSDNSVMTVGSGNQTIGDLTLNGGTVQQTATSGTVNVGTVSVTNDSSVQIATGTGSDINLLDQNNTQTIQIINSTNSLTEEELAKLSLKDINGNELDTVTQNNIEQNGEIVAVGSYNYSLEGDKGIGVNYDLSQLDIQNGQTLTLDADGASNRELTAKLTGTGNLVLASDATGITLNNINNDYSGTTEVTAGLVTAGSDNAFGQTSSLTIDTSATVDLAGNTQTVGSLNNQGNVALTGGALTVSNTATNSGNVDLNGGHLTLNTVNNSGQINLGSADNQGSLDLNNGGTSTVTNGLTGNGTLNVNGGNLVVSATNNLSGNVGIASTASVTLNGAGSLGGSAVNVAGNLNLNSANTVANVLSGNGNINTNAAINLTGDNSGFAGQHVIGKDGNLTVSAANQLGSNKATVQLTNDSANLTLSGVATAIANAISSAKNTTGNVNITNGSDLSFTGNNTDFLGSYNITGNSTLTASNSNNLSTNAVSIADGSTLVFKNLNSDTTDSTELTNKLTGDGTLSLSGTNLTLSSSNSNIADFTGDMDITQQSTFTVNNASQLNDEMEINIQDSEDALKIDSADAFTLNNELIGQGQINVNTSANAFNFGKSVGSDFEGTVDLGNSSFDLAGNNTDALKKSTLVVSTDNITTVGTGTQTIGDLTLNGGTLVFNGDGSITTSNLTTGEGSNSIVKINTNNITDISSDNAVNLFVQNVGTSEQLITAADSTGLAVSDLTLEDQSDKVLGQGTSQSILQNGEEVAEGTYDYQLVNNEKGLDVAYKLTALDLQENQTLELNSVGTEENVLTAQLTGAGSLSLDADKAGITLNNNNTYTGATTVTAGTVTAGSNNAFGQTSGLTVDTSATVDLAGNTQTVGSLNNQGNIALTGGALTVSNATTNSGNVDLSGGHLTLNTVANSGQINLGEKGVLDLNNGGTSTAENGLTGSGTLNVNGGELTIAVANDFTGQTNIASGASVTLNATQAEATEVATLGTSAINIAGNLNLNGTSTVANVLSGAGHINSNAAVTLSGQTLDLREHKQLVKMVT